MDNFLPVASVAPRRLSWSVANCKAGCNHWHGWKNRGGRKEHARGGGARGACFCVIVGIARPLVTISAPNVLHSSVDGRVGH